MFMYTDQKFVETLADSNLDLDILASYRSLHSRVYVDTNALLHNGGRKQPNTQQAAWR